MPTVADDGPHARVRRPAVLSAMAGYMPWLMSLCLHVALAIIFMFVAMIAVLDTPEIPSHLPNVYDPNHSIAVPTPDPPRPSPSPDTRRIRRGQFGNEHRTRNVRLEDAPLQDVVGPASLAGLDPDKNPAKLRGPAGGDGKFFGIPDPTPPIPIECGRHPDVVYLIDRSGSMVDSFDAVRREIFMSVAEMRPTRRFHVVLFAEGKPLENTPGGITPATDDAKLRLVKFLQPIRAWGKTDPVPAINRAFDAIERSPAAIIHLLTDGVFPDNEAVLKAIRLRNTAGRVRVNAILYGNRPPIAEKILSQIASENSGKYRFVSRDE